MGRYMLPGVEGSRWRITSNTGLQQSFRIASIDYNLNTRQESSITLVVGPHSLAVYNHSIECIAHRTRASLALRPDQRDADEVSIISSLTLDSGARPPLTGLAGQRQVNDQTTHADDLVTPGSAMDGISDVDHEASIEGCRRRMREESVEETCKRRQTI